jgi:hypothetical protein
MREMEYGMIPARTLEKVGVYFVVLLVVQQ